VIRNFFFALLLAATGAPASHELHSTPRPAAPLLVGYLPQWGIYNDPPWFARALVTSGAAGQLDQLDYAQGSIVHARCAVADPNADLNFAYSAETSVDGKADEPAMPLKGGFHQVEELKRLYPHLRVLLSLEGKAAAFAEAAQPENRAAFVASCVDMFVRGHLAPNVDAAGLFDGFDIDWEYPHAEDAANFVALLAEFRRQLDAVAGGRRLGLTIAAGPSPRMNAGTAWPAVAALVDHIGLMNYDYNGPWATQTGPIAPLYPIAADPVSPTTTGTTGPGAGQPNPDGTIRGGSVDGTVQAYLAAGVPAGKLLLGVPFYGYHWEQVASANDGLYQPGQSVRDDAPYSRIREVVAHSTLHRDPHSQTPWLYDGHTFWTFDDPVSAEYKANYAATHGLGGVMAWELSNDSEDGALLKAVSSGLHRR
jgi:chitinase